MRTSLLLVSLLMLVVSTALSGTRDSEDGDGLELALQAALVDESALQIDPTEARLLQRTNRLLRDGDVERAVHRFGQFIEARVYSGVPMDVNALVEWVLREAYLDSNEDLSYFAEKVRYFNGQKRQVRELLSEARDCRWRRCATDDDVVAQVQKWEQELNTVGEDAQLANVDLQNALQLQQQTLQTISNVSKLLHDTAKAIICKIG